jgi:hypothetical protein
VCVKRISRPVTFHENHCGVSRVLIFGQIGMLKQMSAFFASTKKFVSMVIKKTNKFTMQTTKKLTGFT